MKHHTIGSLKSFTYGNGLTYSLALHSNKVAIGSILAKNGSTSVISKTYDYDEHGNATSIVDSLNSSNTISGFSYDGADRLEKATSGMWGGEVSFTYDRLGNIKTKIRPDQVMTYNYDINNRLDTITTQGVGESGFILVGVGGVLSPIPFGVHDSEQSFVYDDAGNVVLNTNHTLAYNSANQLAGAFTSGTNGQTYKYDAFGKRVQVTDQNGGSTYEVYDAADRMLMRIDPDGKRTRKVYIGNKFIASDKEGVREYIHFDTLGSTIAISSSSKTLTFENYFPFGERVNNANANNDQWYTGKKFDDFTQLSYHGARFYDPAIGRFYSHDPLDYRDMHSFNRYAYGNNNPFRYSDPSGLYSEDLHNPNFGGKGFGALDWWLTNGVLAYGEGASGNGPTNDRSKCGGRRCVNRQTGKSGFFVQGGVAISGSILGATYTLEHGYYFGTNEKGDLEVGRYLTSTKSAVSNGESGVSFGPIIGIGQASVESIVGDSVGANVGLDTPVVEASIGVESMTDGSGTVINIQAGFGFSPGIIPVAPTFEGTYSTTAKTCLVTFGSSSC